MATRRGTPELGGVLVREESESASRERHGVAALAGYARSPTGSAAARTGSSGLRLSLSACSGVLAATMMRKASMLVGFMELSAVGGLWFVAAEIFLECPTDVTCSLATGRWVLERAGCRLCAGRLKPYLIMCAPTVRTCRVCRRMLPELTDGRS